MASAVRIVKPKPTARVYVDAEPDHGAHPGYRGQVEIDTLGVHIDTECEWLMLADDEQGWDFGEWCRVTVPTLVPWHRVHLIEWTGYA